MLITGTTKLSLETFHATTDIPPPIFATLIFVDRPMEMQVGPIVFFFVFFEITFGLFIEASTKSTTSRLEKAGQTTSNISLLIQRWRTEHPPTPLC